VSRVRIGTRGSALALWQARTVADRLQQLGRDVEIVAISTRGDRQQTEALAQISADVGKGVFTREIQDALLGGRIDLAVHSAKDMSAVPADGLAVAAVLEREDPRDALVLQNSSQHGATLSARGDFSAVSALIGVSPRIGTGSPRRVAQLRRIFSSARFEGIRGNVDTRLRKLDAGEADALVLACAGLRRLGFETRISAPIPVDVCVPAPGQGIIAIETRRDDARTRAEVDRLNHQPARDALAAEQAVVAALGGGCQLPLGAFAEIDGHEIRLRAIAAASSGERTVSAEIHGHTSDAAALGRRLAEQLASHGALELLHD
jgi:hydroxymethylbilane synthase